MKLDLSNVKLTVSNVKFNVSNVKSSVFNVERSISNAKLIVSYMKLGVSNVKLSISNVKLSVFMRKFEDTLADIEEEQDKSGGKQIHNDSWPAIHSSKRTRPNLGEELVRYKHRLFNSISYTQIYTVLRYLFCYFNVMLFHCS